MTGRPRPLQYLLQGGRAFTEIEGRQFKQRQQLHPTGGDAKESNREEPGSEFEDTRPCGSCVIRDS